MKATNLLEPTIASSASNHHCPWVNNCVGHYNYGYFIRFLFFVDVACTYHLAMVTKRVFDTNGPTGFMSDPSATGVLFVVFNYTACVPVIICVGVFSIYHFYCLFTNTTTIEGWEKDKVATLIRRGKIREIKFPYNIGMWANICAILGDNPLLWCWPQTMKGSGLRFPVAEGTGKWIEFHRPHKDHGEGDEMNGYELGNGHLAAPPFVRDEDDSSGYALGVSRSGYHLSPNAIDVRARSTGHVSGDEADDESTLLTYLVFLIDPSVQEVWPPRDPTTYTEHSGPRLMGDSAFTYGTGFNPALRPSNAQLRARHSQNHPHPAYDNDEHNDRATSSTPSRESFSSNEYPDAYPRGSAKYDVDGQPEDDGVRSGDVRVRRGSEGWEVRSMTREEIVQRYLAVRGMEDDGRMGGPDTVPILPVQEPGRYKHYIPESAYSDGDDSDE
ncbi:Palmitoyltransferase [Tulasnella sp. 403]|nr:Palmitoyltransferase [Tulasnella sp. 403]